MQALLQAPNNQTLANRTAFLGQRESEGEVDAGEDVERADAVFAGELLEGVEDGVGVGALVEQVAGGEAELYAALETPGDGGIEQDGVLGLVRSEHGVVVLGGELEVQVFQRGEVKGKREMVWDR